MGETLGKLFIDVAVAWDDQGMCGEKANHTILKDDYWDAGGGEGCLLCSTCVLDYLTKRMLAEFEGYGFVHILFLLIV